MKRRGHKFKFGLPSKTKLARVVSSELYNEEKCFSKKQADKYLREEKKKQVDKRDSLCKKYDQPGAYFIGNKEYKWVKIGFSNSAYERLDNLQTSCPFNIDLLGYIPSNNPRKTEKKLHYKFSDYKEHGEWFVLNDEIEEFLEEINSE